MRTNGRTLRVTLICTGVLLVLYAGLLYLGRDTFESRWTIGDSITGPDGYTYCIMNMNGLRQDPYDRLIRTRDIRKEEAFEELGRKSTTSSWLFVIRPADTLNESGSRLYRIDNNTILAIAYNNKATFAYDVDKQYFYGTGEIDLMSPFMLLDKDTPLYEPDIFAVIMSAVDDYDFHVAYNILKKPGRTARKYLPGCPKPEALREGLNHPNPEIARLSEWLLEIQEHGLPENAEVTRQVLEYLLAKTGSADSNTRYAIVQTLMVNLTSCKTVAIPVLEKITSCEIDAKVLQEANSNLKCIRGH